MEQTTTVRPNPHRTAGRIVGFALIGATILGVASLAAVLIAIGAENITRGGPTLPEPPANPHQWERAITEAPTQSLTQVARISTRHADRARFEAMLDQAVHNTGGHLLEDREDHIRVYAGNRSMALKLQEFAQTVPARSPETERYRRLAEDLGRTSGPPDTRFTVQVTAPMFEKPYLLDATISASFGVAIAIMLTIITLVSLTAFMPERNQKRRSDDQDNADSR